MSKEVRAECGGDGTVEVGLCFCSVFYNNKLDMFMRCVI